MSRLIDADETLQKKWSVEIKDMFHMTETVEVVSAIDIEEAPTVKAIPTEWINKWVVTKFFGAGRVIDSMLEDWEKENEE